MKQIIVATKEQAQAASDRSVVRLIGCTLGPSISQAATDVAEKAEIEAADKENEDGEDIVVQQGTAVVDFSDKSIVEAQALNPVPEDLDPFTAALLGGVDPMAVHQTLTLAFPILAFLGNNIRVLYDDKTLRWMCGQSWQMAGSGCGKSLVLRSLEDLFLSQERRQNAENAQKAAAYSLLSEKERKETNLPDEEVRIMDSIPTALALLQQMQINGGGAMYLSCSECGEFGKKIKAPYYSIILDMMKKSYDGTGEAYMHKSNTAMYYVPSMKLCCNIGGTFDPMYGIFRQCDSDGTLSRGAVTIIGERKDEIKYGAYIPPCWTKEQTEVLLKGAMRLRNFNNTYNEDEFFKTGKRDEEADERVYDSARDSDGNIPSVAEYNISMQKERVARALDVEAFQALGKEIKRYLAEIGDLADDCCSRANERAMAMCYILYVANGLYEDMPVEEKYESMRKIVDVVRWWIRASIDCAIAVQKQLNFNSKSHREEIKAAYKETMGASRAQQILMTRTRALREYESAHGGEVVNIKNVHDELDIFSSLSIKQTKRIIDTWGWEKVSYGKYKVSFPPKDEAKEGAA